MLRYDAQGAGMSPYVGPSAPTIKWTLEPSFHGSVNGLAISADGVIYVAGYDDAFYAVNPDGTVKWRADINFCELNISFVHSPAIGPDGTIYVRGDEYSHLLALDPVDGHERWRVDVASGYGPPVVGNDGVIYIADDTHPGSLYAINPDGTTKWQTENVGGQGPQIVLSPDGARVYSNSYDGLTCLTAVDGRIVWQSQKGYLPAVGPDGVIYANVEPEWNEYQFGAFNPADGSLKWSLDIGLFRPGSRPAIDAGRKVVYVASGGDDHLYAISFSGDVKWAFPCDVGDNVTPSIGGDGMVYINGGGFVYAVDPDSGEQKWRIEPPSSIGNVPPAIGADGTLYVPTWNMVLVAIGDIGMPIPDVKVNGQDGPVFVSPLNPIEVSLAMTVDDPVGSVCEWWLGLQSTAGNRWCQLKPGIEWPYADTPTPLFAYPPLAFPAISLLQTTLPVGIHTAFIILDRAPNGVLDDLGWYDYVTIISTDAALP